MDIGVFDTEIINCSVDKISGIFLAGKLLSIEYLPIVQILKNGDYKIIANFMPNSDFIFIETKYINIYEKIKNCKGNESFPRDIIKTFLPCFDFIGYKYIIFTTKIAHDNNKILTISAFNNADILYGFEKLYNILNKYPNELIIIKKNEEYSILNLSQQILYIKMCDRKIKFNSNNKDGWDKNELLELITERYYKITKDNKKCIDLLPTNDKDIFDAIF